MKWSILIGSAIAALIIADLLRLAWRRWRWEKRTRQVVRDLAWRHWIDQVKTQLRASYGEEEASVILDEYAELFHHYWKVADSPPAAIRRWETRGQRSEVGGQQA
jgi:hypothetical protein